MGKNKEEEKVKNKSSKLLTKRINEVGMSLYIPLSLPCALQVKKQNSPEKLKSNKVTLMQPRLSSKFHTEVGTLPTL